MSFIEEKCHGQLNCLINSSFHRCNHVVLKYHQRIRSYVRWHIENIGILNTFRFIFSKRTMSYVSLAKGLSVDIDKQKLLNTQEVLNLSPGELVEVKPINEILATLDTKRRNKGLLWMTGMRKHCGERYRVLKRVEKIILESNGELRKMKNTVLLEDVMCDGKDFCGCDRSCFHFWREAWLRRVSE